jgi:hypothetical protein
MNSVQKQHLTPLRKRGQVDVRKGKGSVEETLPSRHALSTLTQGDPGARSMNDYAKASPMPQPMPPGQNILGE